MSYNIKFLSLQKSELEYEVAVRGSTPADSVAELRKQIIKLAPILPAEDILESHLDSNIDLKQVKETLIKTQNNIQTLKTKFDKNLFTRTETMIHHLYHRLNRITATTDSNELYKTCRTNFKSQFNDLISLKPQPTEQTSSENSDSATTSSNSNETEKVITCDRNLIAELSKIKFSGKTCVRAFIQRIEEFMHSRNISPTKLMSFAYEIFTDDALHWFRFTKSKVNTWKELVESLKRDFSESDYDYRLLSEIRNRTQGERENITIYLSIMNGMFSRLNNPLQDTEQLEIILHNIRPCYASTLAASPEIDNLDSLKEICRNYETIQSRLKQFREPPKANSDTLAPEFAYNKQPIPSCSFSNSYNAKKHNYYNNANTNNYYKDKYTKPNYSNYINKNNNTTTSDSNKNSQNKTSSVAAISTHHTKIYCPRCRNNSHSLHQCRLPHFPICFKCGKKGVRYPECTTCHQQKPNSKN